LSDQVAPVTVTDVAHGMQLERSTVSRLLGECAAEGLIERIPVPEDGRRVGLQVTPEGYLAIAGSAAIRATFLSYVTQAFDDEEIATLVNLLERFSENLATFLPEWLISTAAAGLLTAADLPAQSTPIEPSPSESFSASRARSKASAGE
jgi:DNA-binding MarR family transcriptional regulator